MIKNVLVVFSLILSMNVISSCGGSISNQNPEIVGELVDSTKVETDALVVDDPAQDAMKLEADLKVFLISTDGTYGWQTKANDISLDFFEDGRLHIQGPDGEATMWEGSWKLKGKRLSMVRPDLKTTETETISKDGNKLMIGAVEYTRYKVSE